MSETDVEAIQWSYLPEDWTSECASLLEHFIWEPQHLGQNGRLPKDKRRSPPEVAARVMRQEVPLNHHLNVFFRLAPTTLIERFFRLHLPRTPSLAPIVRHTRSHMATAVCQPDIFLQASSSRLFIELKINSSTDIDQLCRYAAFAAWAAKNVGPQPTGLLFMGPTLRPFQSIESFLGGVPADFVVSERVMSKARVIGLDAHDVMTALRNTEVAVMTYGQLDHWLSNEAERFKTSEADETVRKLISGLRAFLGPLVS